jgi:hypothetical protein
MGCFINVGTGSSTPTVGQSGLDSFLASTNSYYSKTRNGQTTDPAYQSFFVVYEFAIGSCTGNLTELGISVDSNTDYFNRQLFKDASDNPTTITVRDSEGLRITAEIFLYADMQDGDSANGSFSLDGDTKNYTRQVNTGIFTRNMSSSDLYHPALLSRNVDLSQCKAIVSNDNILMTNESSNVNSVTRNTYTPGDFYRDFECVWDAGTFIGDINTVGFGIGNSHEDLIYSTFFLDSPITLDDTQQLTLNFRREWGRLEESS